MIAIQVFEFLSIHAKPVNEPFISTVKPSLLLFLRQGLTV